jgi:hypothetical protein
MINYNIFWFEDVKSFYNVTQKRLVEKFKETDLTLNFTLSKGKELLKSIDGQTDVDLIFMDENLFKTKGSDLIPAIRKKKLLAEIIYYSNDPDLRENVDNVEGLYFSNKVNLFSKAVRIIEKTAKTMDEVTIQRGAFITDVIVLEAKLVDILLKHFLIGKTGKEEEFRRHIIEAEFFSTYSKYQIISRVITEKLSLITDKNSQKYRDLKALKDIFNKFQREVIEMRNKLAHVKETVVDGVPKFVTKEGEEFEITQSGIKLARKKLKGHSENLDTLISHF